MQWEHREAQRGSYLHFDLCQNDGKLPDMRNREENTWIGGQTHIQIWRQTQRHEIIQSVSLSVNQLFTCSPSTSHYVSQYVSQTVTQSVCLSVSQSGSEWVSQSVNYTVSQSVSQSVCQQVNSSRVYKCKLSRLTGIAFQLTDLPLA